MSREQLRELFEVIDSKNAEKFATYLSEDAVFRYGSNQPVEGREEIVDYVDKFFAGLEGLRHEVGEMWTGDGSLVCQGRATYKRYDGKEAVVPFVNVFRFDGELISEYLIHADPTPLYSE